MGTVVSQFSPSIRTCGSMWVISMRVQHVEAAIQGLVQTPGFAGNPVPFQRPAKSPRWWLWHGRARIAESYLKGPGTIAPALRKNPRLSARLPRACRQAARPCKPILRTTGNPLLNMAAAIGVGCRSLPRVLKVRSMTVPMPALESAEGRGGHQKGLTELPSQGPLFSTVGRTSQTADARHDPHVLSTSNAKLALRRLRPWG